MKSIILFFLFISSSLLSNQFEVCSDCEIKSLEKAAELATPSDTILLRGTFDRGVHITELKGNKDSWIYIIGTENATFKGGNTGLQFSDCEYLDISNITIEGQNLNGVNIDDAGTFDTPTHHIRLVNCTFQNIKGNGNNDLLKLSGLDFFQIINCSFLNGSPGGSGLDMVGCHNGIIVNNYFENMGSNCIQAKGGTAAIQITRNIFVNGGLRAVNIGGSTGLEYFRPQNAKTESQQIHVFSNVFVGGECAVSFVGTVYSFVYNNTIIGDRKWVFRILQETVDEERFLECGENSFFNNLVTFDDSLNRTVNIGPNTRPETFDFSNNFWYNLSEGQWNHNMPSNEENSIFSENPKLRSKFGFEIYPSDDSPIIGKGRKISTNTLDFDSIPYSNPPSIGAFELQNSTDVKFESSNEKVIIVDGILEVDKTNYKSYRLFNYSGALIGAGEIKDTKLDLSFITEKLLILVLQSLKGSKVIFVQK